MHALPNRNNAHHNGSETPIFLDPPAPQARPLATPSQSTVTTQVEDIIPLSQNLMTVEDLGGMQFVRIDCPAVRERQAYALTEPLNEVADRSNGRMTVDLNRVAAFSCAWINVLLSVSKRCHMRGGKLIVAGLSTQGRQMLKQMGLIKQFNLV